MHIPADLQLQVMYNVQNETLLARYIITQKPSLRFILSVINSPNYLMKALDITDDVYQYLISQSFTFNYNKLHMFLKNANPALISAIAPYHKALFPNSKYPATDYIVTATKHEWIVRCTKTFEAFIEEYKANRHDKDYVEKVTIMIDSTHDHIIDKFLECIIEGDERYDPVDYQLNSLKLITHKNFLINGTYKILHVLAHDVELAYRMYQSYDGLGTDEVEYYDVWWSCNILTEEHFKMCEEIYKALPELSLFCPHLLMWLHTTMPDRYDFIQFNAETETNIQDITPYMQYYTKEVLIGLEDPELLYVFQCILYKDLNTGLYLITKLKSRLGRLYNYYVNLGYYLLTGDPRFYHEMVPINRHVVTQCMDVLLKKYGRKVLPSHNVEEHMFASCIADITYLESVKKGLDNLHRYSRMYLVDMDHKTRCLRVRKDHSIIIDHIDMWRDRYLVV